MSILALDFGMKTGWAISGQSGIVSGTEHHKRDRFEGGGMIWLRFRRWLWDIDKVAGGIKLLVFEEVRRHAGTTAAHVYGGFLSQATSYAEQWGIPYLGVPVGTIKKHATGKGNASKEEMIAAMVAKGHSPKDDNEADALALLYLALAEGWIGGSQAL